LVKVKAISYVRNEDVVCDPGDIFDMREALAGVYIKNGWVKLYKIPAPKEIESTAFSGAPETAMSKRGRRRRIGVDDR
jgi:hypothetical protein